MRVNVYNEELTEDVRIVETSPREGVVYLGVRVFLASPIQLHDTEQDDDRSAVTFWVGDVARATQLAELITAAVQTHLKTPPF